MEFLAEFGMFLAKVLTIVVAIVVTIGMIAASGHRSKKPDKKGSLKVSHLNDHFDEMRDTLRFAVLEKWELKSVNKEEKKQAKSESKAREKAHKAAQLDAKTEEPKSAEAVSETAEKDAGTDVDKKEATQEPNEELSGEAGQEPSREASIDATEGAQDTTADTADTADAAGASDKETGRKRVYVLNFQGNIAAEAVACLREEVSAVITMAGGEDEVILRLESPGGMVHAYGLAASQLMRLNKAKIPLTICVDKVAASGGYMMACIADKIVAAPFAIIGSIGVIIQLPNFHKVLKKHDVDYEMISAGEYKRTLTTFGENTEKGREKMQEDVDNIHELFKGWVKDHRPEVAIEEISTGETWVGSQAKDRHMVDDLMTSDECILQACENAEVYEVEYEIQKSIQEKLGRILEQSIDRVVGRWLGKSEFDSYR